LRQKYGDEIAEIANERFDDSREGARC